MSYIRTVLNRVKPRLEGLARRRAVSVFLQAYVVLFPLLLFTALERLNYASSYGLFANPLRNFGAFLFSYALIALSALVVYGVIGSVFWAYAAVAGFWLTVYCVNYFKVMITAGVFVPTDIFLAGAAFSVLEEGSMGVTANFVFGVIFVLLIFVPLWFVRVKVRMPRRLMISAVSLGFVISAAVLSAGNLYAVLGLDFGNVSVRYRDNGVVLGFYSAFREYITPMERIDRGVLDVLAVNPTAAPTPYGQGRTPRPTDNPIHTGAGQGGSNGAEQEVYPVSQDEPPAVIPNVIVIMSEAFADPALWYNITFSRDPIPNFRRLAAEGISGNVLVPVFAGGTANTELEFLLGMPHMFFGNRFYTPFENPGRYFGRDVDTAMPQIFRANGYRTVAVHPFTGSFYNRDRIYPLLGFDRFIAAEQMPDARRRGQFISDAYFTDVIISQIEEAEAEGEPLFLFGISMQNHWGYEPLKYGTLNTSVTAASDRLDEPEIQRTNSYLQGVFDADRQLGRLADMLAESDTPTVLVFFGDHLPIMGRRGDRIFESLGWISRHEDHSWNFDDHTKLFQTPYLVWANYDIGVSEWGDMSTFMLSAKVAAAAGVALNGYYNYVLSSSRFFRGINSLLYMDSDGGLHPATPFRNQPHVTALEMLFQAVMFDDDEFRDTLAAVNR